ncbi:MAG: ABC transporter ATP-binding protein [Nocardioides sp.]
MTTHAGGGAGGGAETPAIRLRGVRKTFGDVVAVDGVDLDIAPGEFFTMLGASGSGKTTLLRVIAGFEGADEGAVELAGVDVTRTPPYDRDVNTVFQDYALFPHMSVQSNVEYGLRVKGVGSAERRRRAGQALELVGLAQLGKRRPAALSGGQRQRVALARSIVNEPSVLLLDEPLGALDLKLRQGMQLELKRIQREAAITFVYVTHDQEEALTMSDRIAVFNDGRIQQVGSPVQIYEAPSTAYVANFIGVSNLLEHDGTTYAVRPERISMAADGAGLPADSVRVDGVVAEVIYLGMVTRYLVRLPDGTVVNVAQQNREASRETGGVAEGDRVVLGWDPGHSHRVTAEGTAADDPTIDPTASSDPQTRPAPSNDTR